MARRWRVASVAAILAVAVWTSAADRPSMKSAPVAGRADRTGRLDGRLLDLLGSDPEAARIERLALRERHAEAWTEAARILADRAARLGPFDPSTLDALQWLGTVAHVSGDQRAAAEILDAVVAARRWTLHPDDPRLAQALLRRGRVARGVGDARQAACVYAEARRILDAATNRTRAPELMGALEQAEADLVRPEDPAAAVEAYVRILERRRHVLPSPSYQLADHLTWLGWTLDRIGRGDEATPFLAEAEEQLRALGLPENRLWATLLGLRAERLVLRGRRDEAERVFREEASIFDSLQPAGPFGRRMCPLDGYDALAEAALRRGLGEEAWVLLETGRAPMHGDLARYGLWHSRDPESYREVRALRSELLEAVRRLARERRLGRSGWEPRTWSLELHAIELRARIHALESRYLERHGTRRPSLTAVQSQLGPRTALMGVVNLQVGDPLQKRSAHRRSWGYLYVLRHEGPIRWIPLWKSDVPPEMETDRTEWGHVFARLFRAAGWPARVDMDPPLLDQLRAWTRHYLDPALPHLDGVEHLVVEGARVPVEAYRDADGRFLVDRFDVSYTPSAALLPLIAERSGRRPDVTPRSALVVHSGGPEAHATTIARLDVGTAEAGPRLVRSAFRRDSTTLAELPRLRYADSESRAVARRFPVVRLVEGGRGDLELGQLAAGGRLGAFDVIHLAGHTLSDVVPERCALALAEQDPPAATLEDGLLDTEEILLGWEIHAQLLTLSACETARASGATRGEELGFTPALFAAGARRILVSLFPVDDRATAILMDRFYENLTGGFEGARVGTTGPLPPARALREAKIHLRGLVDGAGRRPFEHPAYWAGFILVGMP